MADDTETTEDETEDQTDNETSGGTPQDFATWLAAQDEPTQALYKEHTSGLTKALDSERENRRTLEKELRDAAAAAEDGSEVKKKLEEATATAQKASAQSDFYELAQAAGVVDLRLAWLVVQDNESVRDRSGRADFAKLKEAHPALFTDAKKLPEGHAGAGATPDVPKDDPNANIRKAAGR